MSTEQTLHHDASAESLAIARIAVFGMWLWNVANASLVELGRLPIPLLEPIGPLRLLPAAAWAALCSPPTLLVLQACLIACLIALILGVGPFRTIAAFTCVLLVVEQGMIRAVGYMTHGELAMLYAAIVLAAFPCADALALRPARHGPRDPVLYRAPLVAAGLTLCLTYALCATHRFEAGGLGIFLDGTILSRVALRGAERGGLGLLPIDHPWLGWIILIGFPVSTVFELLSPLALFHRRFRHVWLAVIASFQIAVSALMMISFRGNLVLLAIFLTELPQLAGAWMAQRRRMRMRT
jgi:hypothetical protein